MTTREDNKNRTGNQLLDQFKENADWQVAAVVIIALAFLALKLLFRL